jgi:TolA-binding protein
MQQPALSLPAGAFASPATQTPTAETTTPNAALSLARASAASAAAAAPTPQEAVDILFAGYSDIADRLQAAHARIEQLEQQQQQQQLQQQQQREQQGEQQQPPWARAGLACPPRAWDAAVFLLFFLAFINVAGWLALWQAQSAISSAAALPWWASLSPGGATALAASRAAPMPVFAVLLKRLVIFFVPLTNTAVVLTFCAAAVKAALACLRAWE